jgi:Asp-tRNA(Asn)/Glu-tRNA(Gln) amidotransferase B subunit
MIEDIIYELIKENKNITISALVCKVMKRTKGRIAPKIIREKIRKCYEREMETSKRI